MLICWIHWYVRRYWVICVIRLVAYCYFLLSYVVFSVFLVVIMICSVMKGFISRIKMFGFLFPLVETCFWNYMVIFNYICLSFAFPSKIGTWMSVISALFLDLIQCLLSLILFITSFLKGYKNILDFISIFLSIQVFKNLCKIK